MAQVELPQHTAVPIERVAEGIEGLRIAFVNIFGVRHTDHSWTLIDAGIPWSATLIRNWAEKHFSGPPVAIVLTHGHFITSAPLASLLTTGTFLSMPTNLRLPTSRAKRNTRLLTPAQAEA